MALFKKVCSSLCKNDKQKSEHEGKLSDASSTTSKVISAKYLRSRVVNFRSGIYAPFSQNLSQNSVSLIYFIRDKDLKTVNPNQTSRVEHKVCHSMSKLKFGTSMKFRILRVLHVLGFVSMLTWRRARLRHLKWP